MDFSEILIDRQTANRVALIVTFSRPELLHAGGRRNGLRVGHQTSDQESITDPDVDEEADLAGWPTKR